MSHIHVQYFISSEDVWKLPYEIHMTNILLLALIQRKSAWHNCHVFNDSTLLVLFSLRNDMMSEYSVHDLYSTLCCKYKVK